MGCAERAQVELVAWALYGLLLGGAWWLILAHARRLRGGGWIPRPCAAPSLDALVSQAREQSRHESEGARLLAPLTPPPRDAERARGAQLELRAKLDELNARRGAIVSKLNAIQGSIEGREPREQTRAEDKRKDSGHAENTLQPLPTKKAPPGTSAHDLSPAAGPRADVEGSSDPRSPAARVQAPHTPAPPLSAAGRGELLPPTVADAGGPRVVAGPPRVLVGSASAPAEAPREVRRWRLFGHGCPVAGGGRSVGAGAPGLTPDSIATAPNGRRAIEAADVRAALASGIRERAK